MSKINCWEFMKCGRELGGTNTALLGPCPAATFVAADGFLAGKNGGRGCAYITGTFCAGTVQGTHQEKQKVCNECGFYKKLKKEHGAEMSVLSFQGFLSKNLQAR